MKRDAPFWVITSYFNPMQWRRRLENFHVFRRRIGLPLLAVELGREGDFDLPDDAADIVVRAACGDVLWQKERLLNLALRSLPDDCEMVAWVDADVMFERPDWADSAAERLRDAALVQLFDELVHLDPEWREGAAAGAHVVFPQASTASLIADPRFAADRLTQSLDRTERTSANGFAWAARRTLLDTHGFFDRSIVGGGDTAMLAAAFGCIDPVIGLHAMSGPHADCYRRWAEPFHAAVRGMVSHVPGRALHLWHGHLADRSARARHMGLASLSYDPGHDIAANADGAWTWSSDKPALHDYVRGYFASRREDG